MFCLLRPVTKRKRNQARNVPAAPATVVRFHRLAAAIRKSSTSLSRGSGHLPRWPETWCFSSRSDRRCKKRVLSFQPKDLPYSINASTVGSIATRALDRTTDPVGFPTCFKPHANARNAGNQRLITAAGSRPCSTAYCCAHLSTRSAVIS